MWWMNELAPQPKRKRFVWQTWGFLLLLRPHAVILPAALTQTPSDGRAPTLSRYLRRWTCQMDPGSCGGIQRTAPGPALTGSRWVRRQFKDWLRCFTSVCCTCGMIVSLPLRSCKPMLEISTPSMKTEPSAASIILKRQLVRLDFPAPVRPTIPIWKQQQIKMEEKQHESLKMNCGVGSLIECAVWKSPLVQKQ